MSAYRYIEAKGVRLLPLDGLWPLETMLTRSEVARFVDMMLDGVVFPPIKVLMGREDNRWTPQDGWHRAIGSLYAGFSHVPCLINKSPWPERA